MLLVDGAVALDVDVHAGQLYRLYSAAFGRAPDKEGMGFWLDALDHGVSLAHIADAFVHSAEFQARHPATTTTWDLVTGFYHDILHRASEAEGLTFWRGAIDSKAATVGEVLVQFSETIDHIAQLTGVMTNGIDYKPYHP